MSRHWTINGRFIAQPITGVQRYAREIVRALDALLAADHPLTRQLTIELLIPRGAAEAPDLKAIAVRKTRAGGGHMWEQTTLPAQVPSGLLSLCNTGPVAIRRQIVCIHDLNTRAYPESYSRAFRLLYGTLIPALGRSAQRLATVSSYSRSELVRYGVAPSEKIDVIPNGHEHSLNWSAAHTEATRAVAGANTIVMLGSPAPHKNVRLILAMAEDLAAHGLQVAVVGARDARVFQGDGLINLQARNIQWLGRLTDAEMAALLEDSLCLAFPSFAEGFGLPPLEAMARGCPVVSSDRTSLPEICGEGALYAGPTSPEIWLAHFLRLRDDTQLRQALIQRGLEQARRFSWRTSAEAYLKVMAAIDNVASKGNGDPAAP